MAYRDREKQLEYQRQNYQNNKELWKNRQRIRRDSNRKYLKELKLSLGCSICGYNKCPAALDYHHPDNNKETSVSKAASSKGIKSLQKEIDKCILVCANCHRELHFKES